MKRLIASNYNRATASVLAAVVLSFACAASAADCQVTQYKNCVPQEDVMKAWNDAFEEHSNMLSVSGSGQWALGVGGLVYSECDPCVCGDDESSACYEAKAEEARKKEKKEKERYKRIEASRAMLKRAKDFGICNN